MKNWVDVSNELTRNGTPIAAMGYCKIAFDAGQESMAETANGAFMDGRNNAIAEREVVTCLWDKCERDRELMDTECGELHLINVTNDKDFKFCPYCGRTINSLDKPYNKIESV